MPPATAPLPVPLAAPLAGPQCLAHPDWLYHTLTASGPAAALAAFREQAAGAGVVPWVYDYDAMEEDWFYLLLAPPAHLRGISAHGARLLARQLREAPFAILRLGADHPDALAWLWENWGTTWALRHVSPLAMPGAFGVGFWSADWSPWPALRRIQADWPSLRFHCRAHY